MNHTMDYTAVADVIRAGYGITINGQNLAPALGFMVSPYPAREERYRPEEITPALIESFTKRNADLLGRARHFTGAWIEDGLVFLDVSVNVFDRARAVELGIEHRQLAIWDVAKGYPIAL